jgi:DNA-binding transcriptional regulator YdaS (Cro superfamily)
MTPGEAAYKWVTGGKSMRTEGRMSMRDQMAAVEKSAGGKAAAARAAGVSPTTWRRWAAGTQKPKPARVASLAGTARAAVRRARLSPGRESRVRGGEVPLSISARMVISSDERDRDIDLEGDDLDPGALDALVDAYLAGADADELAERLDEVMWSYVPGIHVDEVDAIG